MSETTDIQFDGRRGNIAKFVPLDKGTGNVLPMMKSTWGFKQPGLFITVAGSESDFHMETRLYDTVKCDLMKTAIRTGACFLTSGTNSGVAKLVGKKLENSTVSKNVQVVGIIAMDRIHKMDSSTENNSEDSRSENAEDVFFPSKYSKLLDPNHSHFIVVNDAEQRSELERKISYDENKTQIPTVQIVLGGGYETLEAVYHALQTNTPTVVVKGSTGIACILAYAHMNADKTEHSKMRYMGPSVEKDVREKLKRKFQSNDIEKHVEKIKKCLEKSDLISVYALDSKDGIEKNILEAILKANNDDVVAMLKMTMALKRSDVAKTCIFIEGNPMKMEYLEKCMIDAISLDLVEFVKLFLDNGVNFKTFLSKELLLRLYQNIPKTSLLWSLLEKAKKSICKKDLSLEHVRMVVQKLMGDTFEINLKTYNQNDGKMKMENPSQDLFIWSILTVHQDMAKTFWIKGKDALSSALVAYKLLKSLKSKTENTNTKLANTIDECLNEWSELSVGVLSDCNANDGQKTRELLVREVSIWGDTPCFLIAVNSVNKEFIAEKACQTLLNNIWNGGLANENSFLRLLSCMFCPFLAITVLKYNIDNKKYSKNGKGKIHAKTGVGKQNSVESNRQNLKKSTHAKRGRKPSVEMTTGKHQITPREKLYHFFKAPVIICMYNVLSYIVFLSMFAFLLIFNFGSSLSPLDIALMVWVFTIFTEEVRQMGTTIPSKMCSKLHVYISDVWNKLDIFTIVLFITGMTVRFLPYDGALEAARVMLALNFISFCLRLLHIFSVHKHLGPKLVMMPKMLEDLMYFIVILLVFVVSYAIASHSILYHNSLLTWKTVAQVFRKSYWNIHGELFIDEIEGDQVCTFDEMLWSNGTYPRCPSDVGKIMVPILMGGYIMVASVLLLNVLIAMFTYTFEKMHAETYKHWCFHRYSLISEYDRRPVLFPPLILMNHVALLFKYVYMRCRKNENDQLRNRNSNQKFEKEIENFEKIVADAYHLKRERRTLENIDCKVDSSKEILRRIEEQLQQLRSAHLEMKQQIDEQRRALEALAFRHEPRL